MYFLSLEKDLCTSKQINAMHFKTHKLGRKKGISRWEILKNNQFQLTSYLVVFVIIYLFICQVKIEIVTNKKKLLAFYLYITTPRNFQFTIHVTQIKKTSKYNFVCCHHCLPNRKYGENLFF